MSPDFVEGFSLSPLLDDDAAEVPGCEGLKGEFKAMASRCELLVRPKQDPKRNVRQEGLGDDQRVADALVRAMTEVKRIETKYNRFSDSSELTQINRGAGGWQTIDDETLGLLKFAEHCYRLSQGKFDITAEPVLALWPFGAAHGAGLPCDDKVRAALTQVGFERLVIEDQRLYLPEGMGIDLGGIAKEYAADKAMAIMTSGLPDHDLLVNLGGDMLASPGCERPWLIGIEDPHALDSAARGVTLKSGALATSGHSRRYLLCGGKRYGHIIDSCTGYPIEGAPMSVSVFAPSCVVAGMLATLAMLQGEMAEDFLSRQGVVHHIIRG
ncbi:FAD:protein FMN transferase [Shewanella sp. Isolate7]|uniref:FAD:protein FMN transferase n=1 Tax=Shewanella sp. Isolate7 TaxID=2908528 RepID=UPI001EFD9BCF|nr:FAD:protein FMN transferase [Shewanella sp. Isolate7]MCG9720188.1 FAD:protein FMN transferase [Shewanella sp. Isolate7]